VRAEPARPVVVSKRRNLLEAGKHRLRKKAATRKAQLDFK
jgi:hypothetical protein